MASVLLVGACVLLNLAKRLENKLVFGMFLL